MFRENKGSEALDMNAVTSLRDAENTTILREDAAFEGKLVFDGNVLVNGKLKGEIFSNGDLTVGNSGLVDGTVEIGSIYIFGEVRGNIKAKQKIVINAPAVVKGDIVAPSLVIEEGAVFEGNCSMGNVAKNKQPGKISSQENETDEDGDADADAENVFDLHKVEDNN